MIIKSGFLFPYGKVCVQTKTVLTAVKKNECAMYLLCDDWVKQELSDFFSFYAKGYEYSPLFKAKKWNGKIYLYKMKSSTLPTGLIGHLKKFCSERDIVCDIQDGLDLADEFSEGEAKEFIKQLSLDKYDERDYQLSAFIKAIRYKKALFLSPTSSGKSLIIYLIARYLLATNCKRGLIIVPTISLTDQMCGDFADYAKDSGWDAGANCQIIRQGFTKDIHAELTISTWQSIYELPKKYFEQFDFVIGDECHLFTAKSLGGIMGKLVNAKYRIGTTGTIEETQVNKLTLEGHFGPLVKVITTKELMDRGEIAELDIKCIVLKYPPHICEISKSLEYQQEMDLIVHNQARLKFVTNLASDLKGNTLLLFQYVEKHGKILYNMIVEKNKLHKNRKIFFVYGGTDADQRNEVRRITEQEEDAIIVASYGVFSTGVNIKRLHNIIFASPSKSKIRNLQSIGRGLRLGDGKQKATLYDISDDLRIDKHINFTMQHYAERVKIYHAEKFKISTYRVDLKNG